MKVAPKDAPRSGLQVRGLTCATFPEMKSKSSCPMSLTEIHDNFSSRRPIKTKVAPKDAPRSGLQPCGLKSAKNDGLGTRTAMFVNTIWDGCLTVD